MNVKGHFYDLEVLESKDQVVEFVSRKAIIFVFDTIYNFIFSTAHADISMPMSFSSKQVTMISGVVVNRRKSYEAIADCRKYSGPLELNIEGENCDSESYDDCKLDFLKNIFTLLISAIALLLKSGRQNLCQV